MVNEISMDTNDTKLEITGKFKKYISITGVTT